MERRLTPNGESVAVENARFTKYELAGTLSVVPCEALCARCEIGVFRGGARQSGVRNDDLRAGTPSSPPGQPPFLALPLHSLGRAAQSFQL
jgi:hypothetical protein